MRWSRYPQLELTNEVARGASAIEDASGLDRLNCAPMLATLRTGVLGTPQ